MKHLAAGLILALMSAAQLAQAGVTIVFDYSLDSHGFFTAERRAIAEAAAASLTSRMANTSWARVDASAAGGGYELAVVNPSSLDVSWVPNVVIPENQITVRLGAFDWSMAPIPQMSSDSGDGATQMMAIRNVTGGLISILSSPSKYRPVDASISFNLQGIQGLKTGVTRLWYFGSAAKLNTDDRDPTDPNYNNYSDFYTTVIHELGHVLGIHDPRNFDGFIASDPNFVVAWTSRVQADGSGGFVFTGARASQLYFNHVGQNIPLDADTKCHWGVDVRSQSADGWTSVSYARNAPFRHGFSELEFAALEDMGYTINAASPATGSANFVAGWNLVGNGTDAPIDVAAAFSDANNFLTVWKWVSAQNAWSFYAPALAAQGGTVLADYAASKSYQMLTAISGGEGFWVNAKQAGSVNVAAGNAVSVASLGPSLVKGWNLVSVGESVTPKQFCDAQSGGVTTLWAWDAANSVWYFYSPSLDAAGGTTLADYITGKGYRDFAAASKALGPGVGFWVNKP